MRTIKFRAWDKNNSKMIPPSIMKFWSSGDLASEEFGVPMQFTGLHDKNGRECFEGDIVINKKGDGGRYPCVVVYVEDWGKFCLQLHGVAAKWGRPKERPYYQSVQKVQRWEIVGNIYEHPHLLNETGR